MILIIIIDVLVVAGLIALTLKHNLESALPFFTFIVVFLPNESEIPLPGLFQLTTQRVALTTLTILFFFVKSRAGDGKPLLKHTPLRALIAVHVIWSIISTVNSIVPLTSFKQMLSQVIEYYVMYYVLTRTITSVNTLHKVLGAMVLAVAVASAFGTYEAYYGWNLTRQLFPALEYRFQVTGAEGAIGRGARISSSFGNYSLFGSAVAFAIIEILYLMNLAKSQGRKALCWLAVAAMFLSLYKTASRGPWLAAIGGFCILLVFGDSKSRKHMLTIVALCLAVFVIRPGVWDSVRDIFEGTVSNDPDSQLYRSYEYRYALWGVGKDALSRDSSREIWGYGIESFYYLHLRAPFIDNPEYPYESCDNAWVQQMVETGYVGLVIIGALLLAPAVLVCRRVHRLPTARRTLCWVLLINMAQYYFMMTNLALYSWGQTGYMLWLWIAMAMVYVPLVHKETVVQQRYDLARVASSPQLVGAPQW